MRPPSCLLPSTLPSHSFLFPCTVCVTSIEFIINALSQFQEFWMKIGTSQPLECHVVAPLHHAWHHWGQFWWCLATFGDAIQCLVSFCRHSVCHSYIFPSHLCYHHDPQPIHCHKVDKVAVIDVNIWGTYEKQQASWSLPFAATSIPAEFEGGKRQPGFRETCNMYQQWKN